VKVSAEVEALTAVPVAAVAGYSTGTVTVATFTETDGAALVDPVWIVWEDGVLSAGTVVSLGGDEFAVQGEHTYQSAGTYLVGVLLDTSVTGQQIYTRATVLNWQIQGQELSSDPQQGMLYPIGQAQVALNTGDLHLSQALDFDRSPGTDVGRNPALVYNSGTVGNAPIIQLTLHSSADEPKPDEIIVALAWDGGAFGPEQTFQTSQHEPGSDYLLAVQAGTLPEGDQSGVHGWQARVKFVYGTGDGATVAEGIVEGTAQVVDQRDSAIGAGWGIAGVDHLVPTCTGVLWVSGTGDAREYEREFGGTFTSPLDFGSLERNSDGSWTYTAKDQTIEQFNAHGWLTQVIDTHGLVTAYHYDDQDHLTEVDSIDGGVTTLEYDGGLLVHIVEPGGRVWTLSHTGDNLTSLEDPTGATRHLGYSGALLTSDNWQPLQTSFGYQNGRLSSIDQGGGSLWTVTAAAMQGMGSEAGFVADATAVMVSPLGHADSWTLDGSGLSLVHTRADLRSETWQRDEHGQVSVYTDFLGYSTDYHYDYSTNGKGDLLEVDDPDGGVVHYNYEHTFHHVTQTTDQDGRVTDNSYDPATGDLLSTTVAPGTDAEATTSWVWQDGLVVSTTDAAGDTTDYHYTNRLVDHEQNFSPDNSLASETFFHYDAAGNLDRQTDGEDFVTSYSTDGVNRVTQTTDADGTTTQHYTDCGLMDSSTDPRDIVTTNDYDTRGLLTSTTVDNGGGSPETTTYTNDLDGRLVEEESPLLEQTHFSFDVNAQQVVQVDPLGYRTISLPDDDGRVVKSIDANGSVTLDGFDVMGRVTDEQLFAADGVTLVSAQHSDYSLAGLLVTQTDGDHNTTHFGHDAAGNPSGSETDDASGVAVRQSTEKVNSAGEVVREEDGDGNVTVRTFNGDGNVLTEVVTDNQGNVVRSLTNTYYHDGRLYTQTDGDNNRTEYTYHPDGQVWTQREYDRNNHLVRSLTFTYDADGNLHTQTDGDNNTTTYTYTDENLVHTEVTTDKDGNVVRSITHNYNGDNEETSETDGDGNTTVRTYDAGGNVKTLKVYDKDNHLVRNVAYNLYDGNGNVLSETDGDGNTTIRTFNAANQVLSEQVRDRNITLVRSSTFQYDLDGNTTTTVDGDGNQTISTYDGDQLVHEVVKDRDNNIIRDTTFEYDLDGNTKTVTDGDGNVTTSTYLGDQLVHEVVKDRDGHVVRDTTYEYDQDGNVKTTTDGDGNVTTSTFLGDQLVHEIVKDRNGATVRETTYVYDLDGNTTTSTYGEGNVTTSTYLGDELVHEEVRDKYGTLVRETNYEYDEDGNVTTSVDGDGNTTTSTFLGDQLVHEVVTDRYGAVVRDTSYVYDTDGNQTISTDGNGNTTTRTYLGDQLVHEVVTDRDNNVIRDTSFVYDLDGNVTTSTDGDGNTTTSTFKGDQLVHEVVKDKNGALVRDTTFVYDEDGNVTTSTDGDGNTTTKTYLGDQLIHEVVKDRDNNVIRDTTYEYDLDGNTKTTTDGDGNVTTSTYLGDQLVHEVVKDRNGHVVRDTTYQYDEDGNVKTSTDGEGNQTISTFLGDLLVHEVVKDKNGAIVRDTSYLYDLDGNVTTSTDGDGNTTTSTYLGDELVHEVVRDRNGALVRETTYQYDEDGNVTTSVDGDGNTNTSTFLGDQLVHEVVTDRFGAVVRENIYHYDEDGNVTISTDGDGNVTTSTYLGDQLVHEIVTDPAGNVISDTTYEYDEDGNVTTMVDGDGNTTTSTYLGDQLVHEIVTDRDGNLIRETSYEYDEDGNVITTVDGDGKTTTQTYLGDQLVHEVVTNSDGDIVSDTTFVDDEDGNVKTTIDGDGNTTVNIYLGDQLAEEVVKDIHGVVVLDTHFLYDLDGNVTSRTDGDGNVTTSVYLGDQLMHQEVRNAAGQVASSVDFTYDHDGYVASETDGDGNSTVYTRDVDGNVLSMTTPLGTTTYHYDKDGNRTFLLDPLGRSIVYAYDGNRLATAIWYNANGSVANVLSYGYDEDGNLTSASNNAGSYTFHYDGDELTQEVTPAGVVINFTQHDEQGNATQISDSFGATVTAHYNADGRLDHTTYSDAGSQAREDMVYDNAGLLVSQSRYADTAGTTLVGTTAVGYHGPVLIGVLQHSDGAGIVLASFTYGYDTAGWLTSESTNGANTIGYGYDGAGQLMQAGDQTWGYDPNGNPNTGGAVVAGNNQLVSDGTWTYSYDAAGNVISRSDATAEETWTYSYDTVNELVSATETGPFGVVLVQASYQYDAFGNRIETAVTQDGQTTTTRSVYMPVGTPEVGAVLTHWRLWADTDGAGTLQTHYLSGDQPDQWLARIDAGANGVRWLLPDKQNSVRLVVDNTEGVIDEISYNPWGVITTETAPEVGGRFKYAGYEQDDWTQIYHEARRYYLADAHRFLTQDPLGLLTDSNPYRPVGNGPTNATDPSGLERIGYDGKYVYWVVQKKGWIWDSDVRWVYIGTRQGNTVHIDGAEVLARNKKLRDGASVDVRQLETYASRYWREFSDISSQPAMTQELLIASSLERIAVFKRQIKTASAAAQIASAAGEGLADGAVIVANQLTFEMIPGLDKEAKDLVKKNGGLYEWSEFAGKVAAESISTVATGGLASGAMKLGAKVLGKLGGTLASLLLSKANLLKAECAVKTAGKVLQTGMQIKAVADEVTGIAEHAGKAVEAYEKGDNQTLVKELLATGIQGFSLKTTMADLGKTIKAIQQKGLWGFLKSCFGAGTPLRTQEGSKLIEQFQPGDLIVSRHEGDRNGPIEAKVVLAVFARTGRILHLHAGGQVIRTTPEHPFWVEGAGWLEAGLLRAGDLVCSEDGQWVLVEEVYDTGEYETVYNLCVADFHTYYVGCQEWGWSVWAHNADCARRAEDNARGKRDQREHKLDRQAESDGGSQKRQRLNELRDSEARSKANWPLTRARSATAELEAMRERSKLPDRVKRAVRPDDPRGPRSDPEATSSRDYFKNNKQLVREATEEKTGELWPIGPTGRGREWGPFTAEHIGSIRTVPGVPGTGYADPLVVRVGKSARTITAGTDHTPQFFIEAGRRGGQKSAALQRARGAARAQPPESEGGGGE
jgi:RHS repeat-associated protein